jgi:hypothetical protein
MCLGGFLSKKEELPEPRVIRTKGTILFRCTKCVSTLAMHGAITTDDGIIYSIEVDKLKSTSPTFCDACALSTRCIGPLRDLSPVGFVRRP